MLRCVCVCVAGEGGGDLKKSIDPSAAEEEGEDEDGVFWCKIVIHPRCP